MTVHFRVGKVPSTSQKTAESLFTLNGTMLGHHRLLFPLPAVPLRWSGPSSRGGTIAIARA